MKYSWKLQKLGDVVEINPRKPSVLSELSGDHLVTFVPMAAVDEESGTIEKPEVRPYAEVKKGFTYFAEGDVIFAKITPCMQNGKAAIATGLKNRLGFGSTEFHVLRPIAGHILADWIWFFVRQPQFRREAVQHFRGSAGQQRVPESFLANYAIPVPSIDVQNRIVDRIKDMMERVSQVKSLRESSLDDLEILEKAVFADFVEANRSDPYPTVPLGKVLSKVQYGTSQKSSATGNGIPILRMGNIQNGSLDTGDLKFIELPDSERRKYRLSEGDILFNRTNSLELVGKAATFHELTGDWVFASYLVRLVVDRSQALPEYITAVINSRIGRDFVNRNASRAIGMVNINAKKIQGLSVPLPPVAVQQHLVEKLQTARSVTAALYSEMNAKPIEGLTQAILRKAFAGEL